MKKLMETKWMQMEIKYHTNKNYADDLFTSVVLELQSDTPSTGYIMEKMGALTRLIDNAKTLN